MVALTLLAVLAIQLGGLWGFILLSRTDSGLNWPVAMLAFAVVVLWLGVSTRYLSPRKAFLLAWLSALGGVIEYEALGLLAYTGLVKDANGPLSLRDVIGALLLSAVGFCVYGAVVLVALLIRRAWAQLKSAGG